jgi:hypothetical protein
MCLQLFLFVDGKVWDTHGNKLPQAHNRSMSEFLAQPGCEPQHLFFFSALENQLSKYSLLNLDMAFFLPY